MDGDAALVRAVLRQMPGGMPVLALPSTRAHRPPAYSHYPAAQALPAARAPTQQERQSAVTERCGPHGTPARPKQERPLQSLRPMRDDIMRLMVAHGPQLGRELRARLREWGYAPEPTQVAHALQRMEKRGEVRARCVAKTGRYGTNEYALTAEGRRLAERLPLREARVQ